jgi:hypothetical protein
VRVTGLQTVSSPLFNPNGGNFNTAVDVTITCPTPGATIHYTTNGVDPTEFDPIITSGVSLRLNFSTSIRARAWKPGLVPSSITFASFDVQQPPPQLLLEENGPVPAQLVAVDSVLFLRDPFSVINPANWGRKTTDPNTRVIVFASNLPLLPGEPAETVRVDITSSGGLVQFVRAEDVRPLPGTNFMQVVFRLPSDLQPGTYQIQLFAHLQVTNGGTIRIKP